MYMGILVSDMLATVIVAKKGIYLDIYMDICIGCMYICIYLYHECIYVQCSNYYHDYWYMSIYVYGYISV
jgi:hypothetical protein